MNTTTAPLNARQRFIQNLAESELFQHYQKAFNTLTSLPLCLETAPEDCHYEGVITRTGVAGVVESKVPVKVGKNVIALMLTGAVRLQPANADTFAPVAKALLDEDRSAAEIRSAKIHFDHAPVMAPERYDAAIANWMAEREGEFPDRIIMGFDRALELSYGENPHQRAAYYTERGARVHLLSRVDKVHGKDLSFNNLFDLDAGRNLLAEFELPACVIIKHNNPCGVAVASDVMSAYTRARDCDPVSAYGGVIVLNRPVDGELGELLAGTFVEVLLAPGYDEAAMAALTRKPNTRIMVNGERRRQNVGARDLRRVVGGLLIQDRDAESEDRSLMTVATQRQPTEREWGDLLFAWRVGKHVKSNAIVLARDLASVGIGAGQMSRVDSVRLSIEKAQSPVEGTVLASDAFFPFADGPAAAIEAGVTAIIQPGGSIRDDEVVAAADAAGIAMVMTGRRHFKH